MSRHLRTTLRHFPLTWPRILAVAALVVIALLNGIPAANACTANGCITVGPRLASVNSSRGYLLNALLGNLTGSTLTVTALDWNAIAVADVGLAKTLEALQATLSVSTPAQALSADATVAQLLGALATVTGNEGSASASSALTTLRSQLTLVSGTIKLGDLLSTNGATGNTRLNVLDLVSGILQLYNYRNVATTPSPIGLNGIDVGVASIGTLQLWAQVVEPPVYICGPVSSQFYTAAIRVKLALNLVTLNLPVTTLTALLGVSTAEVKISNLDVYVDIARGQGTITAVNAIANTLTVQATPGVADIWIGTISNANFFTRGHALVAGDLDYATIGSVKINALTVALKAKTHSQGQAPIQRTLSFTTPYPNTQTAQTNASFATNLAGSLITNLSIDTTPDFGLLDALVQPVLKIVVQTGLTTILGPILNTLVNPLLELLGIRLGEVDVTAGGAFYLCTVAGNVYADSNHSALKELGESGTGLTLYAKLVSSGSPTLASDVAVVDPTTGAFTFSNIASTTYSLLIDTSNTKSDITVTPSTGWIATEVPTLTRSVTVANTSTADVSGLTFGLYNGSKLIGSVFNDNGITGGTANNGTRDGAEAGLAGITVAVTNNAGSTTYDSAVTADQGSYTLWIPASAGANPLKLIETNGASYFSIAGSTGTTSGTYTRTTDTVAFTHVVGSTYTGVNFADVPANLFLPDGQQTALPGTVVFYPHSYTAGSAGQLTVTLSAPNPATWSQIVYIDSNCNAAIDAGEPVLSAAQSLTTSQKLCTVVRVSIPAAAPYDAHSTVTLSASFSYANSAVTAAETRNDITIVGNATAAGLRLAKTVDKATAKSGDVITYTVSYDNRSSSTLSTLKIYDTTPAYTVFNSAACGALPTGMTACTLTTQPAAGVAGPIQWSFTGQLLPGATGSVTFAVTLQ